MARLDVFICFCLIKTIGAAFVAKALNVGDKVITLGIWVSVVTRVFIYACRPLISDFMCFLSSQDTAGSERYEAMSRIYYRGARAAIVCYGISLSHSLTWKVAFLWKECRMWQLV